jgi:hypothetical protein
MLVRRGHIWFIFHFQFAGFLPVVSGFLMDNSLIINTIHFSGVYAFSGWICLSEPLIYLILLIHMKWVDMLVRCGHIGFIVYFQFAGLLPVIFVFFDVTH